MGANNTEQLIEEAILFAQSQGINISGGGAIFNWQQYDAVNGSRWTERPISCNAMGAILLKLGKENMAKESFNPEWYKIVCSYLGEDPFWLNRFVLGFDYGAKIKLIKISKDKKTNKEHESFEQDKASALGAKLANKFFRNEKH